MSETTSKPSQERGLDAWDALGLLATTASMCLVATWGAVRANPGYHWLPEALFGVGTGGLVLAAAASVALARRRSLSARQILPRLAGVWLDPPRDWLMFVFGFLLALPALALHTSVLFGDSDSARIISSTMYVQRNGLGYLVDTQASLLPHLTMGPLLAAGGIPAAKLGSIVSLQVLVGSVSFLAWKLTRSQAATLASVAALLTFPVMWERANLLTLYPVMLAGGLLGLYFAQRATVLEGRERAWAAIAAGTCFVLSVEANRIGEFFLAFTLFLFLTAPWKPVARGLARVYLVVVVLSIPRIVINLWEGGFTDFFSNRVDYWITEGYLRRIQEDYVGMPVGDTVPAYLSRFGTELGTIFSLPGLLVLGLAFVGLILTREPARRFAFACVAAFAVAVVYRRIPFYPRYLSPLMVAGALGAGVAVQHLLRSSRLLKGGAVVALVILCISAGATYVRALDKAERKQKQMLTSPFRKIAREIDDGKGIIGARSGSLLFVSPRLRPYGGQFLTEREFVTYLTWPSDQKVIDVMRAHDIGWVLISSPRQVEIDYHNAWLEPAYGKTVRDIESVAASPRFCRVREVKGFILYKLGPCPSGQ